jgi:pantoate--beta-alanine ligase
MYPPGYQTWVTVEDLTAPLEGAQRPEHFRGVTTVVAKLFNAVAPQRAYFGQKDAQQAIVIKRMTADMNFPIEVIVKPIVREPDGLALSSRNAYLNPAQRKAATVLSRALRAAQEAFESGLSIADGLREIMVRTIASEPLARVQYVSCADPGTLQEIQGEVSAKALLSMAVYVGKTRLIDNVILER